MLAVVESLIPIFLLILAGFLLRRKTPVASDAAWAGMEKLSFYIFFPSLLFLTLYRADFSGAGAGSAVFGFLTGATFLLVLGIFLRGPVRALLGISDASYSSVYQGFTRWNGFVALAIVDKLFGQEGLVIVAFAFLAIVIPINVVNVVVLTWLGSKEGPRRSLLKDVGFNPIVLAALAGSLLNLLSVPIYEPFELTIDMVSRISLPLGLLLVGAGLRPSFENGEISATVLTAALKLVFVPAVLVSACWLFGMRGNDLIVVSIAGSVPTAMQGYVLAREMGGDAPLYASIATFQAIACAFTIPLVIFVATLLFAS